jgi:asparagine synthase (glutamine-hydrolysing)
MCGIAGVYNWREPTSQQSVVSEMMNRLRRRGPDGSGVHSEAGIALGHRRLSIIDLSERGAQPLSNEDGTIWLSFNGEIYNYRQLRRELESRGHRFRSDSDSEVLVHLYEDSKDDLLRFLASVRGMFGFAIWDRGRQRLVLARDRLGIKPLVFYLDESFIAFASDLDALTACPGVPRKLDWTSLFEYLVFLTIPGPNTIFQNVRYLSPGSILSIERGVTSELRYWGLESDSSDSFSDYHQADEAIEETLDEAVRFHLIADVEVGAFLSAGVDSGLVTAIASESGGRKLRTFAATFPGEEEDEGSAARSASELLGTRHTEFAVTGGFLDSIVDVVAAMDQPLALTSAVSLFQLSQRASAEVKVVLTGDGGDELFGGYSRHRPYAMPSYTSGRWSNRSGRPTGMGEAQISYARKDLRFFGFYFPR